MHPVLIAVINLAIFYPKLESYPKQTLLKEVYSGDTVVLYKPPKLNKLPDLKPNLSNLKNNDDADLKNKPLRMVCIGGGVTAGMRDGGYFNEGITTSYANLLARQMQLEQFRQPYFSEKAYNGYGRKTLTNNNPTNGVVPKFNLVTNNSAILEQKPDGTIKIESFNNDTDNFAVPYSNLSVIHPYNVVSPSNNTTTPFYALLHRIFPKPMTFTENVFRQKFDFFIYEIGFDYLLQIIQKGSDIGHINITPNAIFQPRSPFEPSDLGTDIPTKFMRKIEDHNIQKGCILNVPDMTKFPYFKIIDANMYNRLPESIFGIRSGFSTELVSDEIYLLPTMEVDSLFSDRVPQNLKKGLSKGNPLSKSSYLTKRWMDTTVEKHVRAFNTEAENFAKYFKFPLVDINTLYSKILRGNYMTDDGVLVDASYPNGNFFSADGIYPTALGQAIIANEVIKAINNYYKTNIPLINTKELL